MESVLNVLEVLSSMDQVQIFTEQVGDEGFLYDVNVAIENIRACMPHQIRDAQQKLAKVTAFQNLDEVTGFCQKNTNNILFRINKRITHTNNGGDCKMHASDHDLANEMMLSTAQRNSDTLILINNNSVLISIL